MTDLARGGTTDEHHGTRRLIARPRLDASGEAGGRFASIARVRWRGGQNYHVIHRRHVLELGAGDPRGAAGDDQELPIAVGNGAARRMRWRELPRQAAEPTSSHSG